MVQNSTWEPTSCLAASEMPCNIPEQKSYYHIWRAIMILITVLTILKNWNSKTMWW